MVILIGIAGPSASGKSTLCERLAGEGVGHLKLDDFYKDEIEMPHSDGRYNWEVPESLHLDRLYETLIALKQGKSVEVSIYNKRKGRGTAKRTIVPREKVIAEGFLLFYEQAIRELFDLRLFLDVSAENQLARRLQRQPELDREYFARVILPTFEQYGLPTRKYAHLVIDGDQPVDGTYAELRKVVMAQRRESF